MKKETPRKGKICVYKDNHRKYIDKQDLEFYLLNGYSNIDTSISTKNLKFLKDKVNYDKLFDYYEIQNHTKRETIEYFNISISQLNTLLKYYKIKKSSKNRGLNSKKGKLIKYGNENFNNREKSVKTCLNRYGVECPLYIDYVRESTSSSKTRLKAQNTYLEKTGKKVWNDGEKGLQKWTEGQKDKYYSSLSKNNWFQKSKVEESLYKDLLSEYDKEDIIRGYVDKERYPFRCDFYIKSEDLFIELNRFWHHGPHPFDSNNKEDLQLLEKWKNKATNNNQYSEAIKTWTIRDVKKIQTAKENNLNYKLIY